MKVQCREVLYKSMAGIVQFKMAHCNRISVPCVGTRKEEKKKKSSTVTTTNHMY